MNTTEFNKLLKKEDPKRIIYLYCTNQIYLYSKQLDKVIDLKNEKEK